MLTSNDIRNLIIEACAKFGSDISGSITVQWNNRFTRRLGDARWWHLNKRGIIRLSVPLWGRTDEKEQRLTVLHELAHILTFAKYGNVSAHGWEWKNTMRVLGAEASRCHNVDRTGIARKYGKREEITVYCGCEKKTIGLTRYKRMVTNGKRYKCLLCGMPISLHPIKMVS